MSRFEDTLRRDLEQIADRATPSPDAWAQIQSRIADQEPDQETEIIMLTENTLTRRRWPLVAAAAAAVVALIVAIAAVNRDTEPEIPADTPEPVPTTPNDSDDETTVEADDTVAETAVDEAGPAFDSLELGEVVPPGDHQIDRLGVPISFEVPEPSGEQWTVLLDNAIALSIGTDDGFVAFTRVGSFFDGAEAVDPQTTGLGSIPPDAIDDWIDATGADVVDSGEVEIDGRSASYRRIAAPEGAGVDTGLCPAEAIGCLLLSSPSADLIDEFPNSPSRVGMTPASFWFIELDDFEPLGIWVSAPPVNADWLDQVQPLIDSIRLGTPGPAIEFGTARLPLREQFFATATTPRDEGTVLEDGSIERVSTSVVTGDLTGDMAGTGIELSPANGYDDLVFTGTIDGIGTGTLTMYQEWTASQNGDISFTTTITDASGDFAGITGRVITSLDQPDESGPVPIFTSRLTFQLAIPTAA